MQDVTDLPFWTVMHRYGGPDLYFTEYFRVHPTYSLDRQILKSIVENPTGRPVIAQMIGNDIPSLVRVARELQKLPVLAIDLNLGCPAPVVYKKCAGGGLLREPDRVAGILSALREAIEIPFTVKTRVGFDSVDLFEKFLEIFLRSEIDLLTVHGRTVQEMYRSPVRYDLIRMAAGRMKCPVLANGNISSPAKAAQVLQETGVKGWMIGRGAIRNPWIFQQIRQHLKGEAVQIPVGHEVLDYIRNLYQTVRFDPFVEKLHVQKMKKYMNFLALGIEPTGRFLHDIRRVVTESEFFRVCEEHLAHNSPMPLEPYSLDLKSSDLLAGVHT